MNRLREMEVFTTVVDAGSISAAADRMGMAKSAVSKRLGDLESRLGVTLLNRTTRRMSLTSAGSEFYQRCDPILKAVADAETAVTESDAALTGRIRIAAPLSFGIEHLGPALSNFMQTHPGISVDLDFNDRPVDLVAEGFDLAIRIARLSDSNLVARKLTSIRNVICASPSYWDRHGRPRHPNDLKQHTALRYTLAAQRSWSYRAPDGRRGSVTVPAQSSANNGEFLSQAAATGAGVVVMPVFIVYRMIEAGQLEPVLLDYIWGDNDAWAVYPKTRHLPYRIRVLIDALADTFGEEPYWDRCLKRCQTPINSRSP